MDVASATAVSGLQQAQTRLETTARRIASPASPGNPVDAVSLSDEAVSLIQSRNDFAANLNVLKTADQMQQDLLQSLRP